MARSRHDAPTEVADAAADMVLPFRTERSRVSGRIVRLSETVNTILTRHDYPLPVAETLGQAIALAALLGTGLKFDGRLIVQTKTDGPLGFLVVDYETPGRVRGYASFDNDRIGRLMAAGNKPSEGDLIGAGHLAMTIDPGGDMDRYQGIVAMQNTTLAEGALTYFRQSEQLPTFLRLAIARERIAGAEMGEAWRWRAGGVLLQNVAHAGGHTADEMADQEERGVLAGEEDDHWRRVALLAGTVEDHELVDPTLAPERLLYRLFHEEGVRVQRPIPVEEHCKCSREKVGAFLRSFGPEQLKDMREPDGTIAVTCEFCSTRYPFSDDDLH
ncbi:MAG: Hsp33 family molecular chaperone [Hyphomicrobiaceae bacterium]